MIADMKNENQTPIIYRLLSSVYDVLEDKFIENGLEKLSGNEQTLRNYVHYLEESGQIDTGEEHRRIYDHVFDTPLGGQMLIDFGEVTLSKKLSIHFICLLLRYERCKMSTKCHQKSLKISGRDRIAGIIIPDILFYGRGRHKI